MFKPTVTLLLITVLLCLSPQGTAQSLPVSYAPLAGYVALEHALLVQTNEARAAHGLPPLKQSEKLALAARHHAAEMARLGYLSHNSPTPASETLAKRVARAGLAVQTIGENIASIGSSRNVARTAVQGWMASPGHRANLLSSNFSHVGFGTAVDDQGVTYVVQDFAYQPLALEEAGLLPYTARSYDVTLTLQLERPHRVLLVYGQTTSRPLDLTAGRQTLRFTVTGPEQVHLSAAVKSPGTGYILQDEGWLDLARGRFSPSSSATRRELSIQQVRVTPRRIDRYRVTLNFDAQPQAPLAVWLNGQQLESTSLSGRSLQFDVTDTNGPQVIDLGMKAQGNRYRVVMSLALEGASGGARLVPHVE